MPAKQLLIGLDAMEFDLVSRWADQGKLPAFRRFFEQGTSAELSTTSAQLPDTVWACLYTAVNPAKLEKYFYIQYNAKTLDLRHITDDEIRRKPFWDYVSEAGLRVGVADAPKFRLSSQINGFQLTNWGAHATKTARASNPPGLLAEIESRFGRHPVGDCDSVDAKPEPLRQLRERIVNGVAAHGRLFRWLLSQDEWAIFFGAFSAPHCIGHHFWHCVDPTHPRYGEKDDSLADSIEQTYRAIDREIDNLVAEAGPEARCMLVAAHGMGPMYHATWNVSQILELLGYGRGPTTENRQATGTRPSNINPWRVLKMVVPGKVQYGIKAMLPQRFQDELLFRWYARDRDWKGRIAFSLPNNDSVAAIRVSVKGRDYQGLIEPGQEYAHVCSDIASAFRELVDPVSGRKVVRRVTLTHEEFHGPFLEELPDITILWETSFPWTSLRSPRFGTLKIRDQDSRTGSHSTHGFLLAAGPGVPVGEKLEGCSIYDITPTILECAGVPVPPGLDGRPISSLVKTAPKAGTLS